MAGAMSPETSLRNVLPEFEDTRPPSDPLPKNCDCRYHIIVTNVNRKADATHRNYRWRCGGGAGWWLELWRANPIIGSIALRSIPVAQTHHVFVEEDRTRLRC